MSGKEFTLNLMGGDEVLEKLMEFAQNNDVKDALFVGGEGVLKNFELSEMRGAGKVENKVMHGPHELIAVSGRMYKRQGKHITELKVSLAKAGRRSISGMLLRGIVQGEAEIKIRLIDLKKMVIA
ncbi:MAG: DUF296 domain-containing protein [archaeon]|nr:DNA-binding protein [Candidatus Micrarchaeota archaeon]